MISSTGPFALIPEWVLDSSISDKAKLLYCVLSRYADKNGSCFPSVATLSLRLSVSEATVKRAKRELIRVGALKQEARGSSTGGRSTNVYYLDPADPGFQLTGDRGFQITTDPPITLNESQGSETTSPHVESATKARRTDPLWDVFDEALGKVLTDSARGRRNKALKELRLADATPDLLRAAIAAYKRDFAGMHLTETAIAANWHKLVGNVTTLASCPVCLLTFRSVRRMHEHAEVVHGITPEEEAS